MANGRFSHLLKDGGFQAFLWTQFLGAFNDSFYQSVVLLHAERVDPKFVPISLLVFNLPFLLFSGYAGHLADRVSKRLVMIGVKFFEVAIMLLGLGALISGNLAAMMAVMFLLGLHSTVFSPAKYGIIPEMWPDQELSRANALLEMSTFVAMVMGMSVAAFLFGSWGHQGWPIGAVTVSLAVVGLLTSFRITRVPPSGSTRRFQWNPFGEVMASTRHLVKVRTLWLTVLGICNFWFLGALFKMILPHFGTHVLHASDTRVGLLWTFMAVGVGTGNMLAGRLSGNKVELGLVPLGSILMGLATFALCASHGSYVLAVAALSLVGLGSGLYVVPLYAYMQQKAGDQEKGRVVAANNFYQTIAMLLASVGLMVAQSHMTPVQMLLGMGILTALSTIYILTVVPDFFLRFVLWLLTHSIFRIRIVNNQNVPFRGPALLVANHMSHVDGFLVGACVQRFVRFLIWKPYYEKRSLNWFCRKMHFIPVSGENARDAIHAVRAARQELAAGHVVCIFAEGAISRTGNMLPFKRGLEKIVEDLDVPVIPVHLDRLWGSIFSFERGRFFWKWPKRIPYPVTVSFGTPMRHGVTAQEVRQAIQELASDATEARKSSGDRLDLRLVRSARSNWRKLAMADSSGRELSYGRMLAAANLMANWMRRSTAVGERVGVLLPSSTGGALVNIGATMAGRIPVNLNFTAGADAMESAIAQCEIGTILTSKLFLTRAKLEARQGMVFVEDILAAIGPITRLRALVAARLLPARWLCRGGHRTPDSTATILFSSGSTGTPKGVVLSHYNVLANIEAIAQVFWITEKDRIVGGLPFFHSFGYTVTIWFPLISGCAAVYHPNPTDARAIATLVSKYGGTFLLSTPTLCAGYTRKCTREEFASLRYVLVGAEKLRQPVADAFQEKFGVALLEGYGCTEMAPVVAVNVPDFEDPRHRQAGNKPGTVGHPLPGVAAKIVDPVTFQPLAGNEEGLLLVKGSNRMQGYLNQAQLTSEALHDGWYVTNDIARIDDQGFIQITDRLARFSKIAGEMVPHIRVEEAVGRIVGDGPCAVTAVSDDQRGERLVAFYVRQDLSPAELWQRLRDSGLPLLWLPKRENLYAVEELPLLGSGKLDLRALRLRAEALTAADAEFSKGA